MAATHCAPKHWYLGKFETVNSFDHWRQNLTYTLTLDPNFALLLVDGFTWEKRTKANPLRGFRDRKRVVLPRVLPLNKRSTYWT